MAIGLVMLVTAMLLLIFSQITSATDTLTKFQSLRDGMSLVSNDESFELGFFSPGSSTNRYVGIWYKNIPARTVVWVANRHNPIRDNSSMLIIREGNLVLLSENQTLLWSTNSTKNALSPIVRLLDTGNLVLKEDNTNHNEESFLWQSFDYPSDTFLSGMKLGWDLKTGLNRRLTAWKNWDDPSPGDFTVGIVLTSNPEMVTWKGTAKYQRTGPWNGVRFSGSSKLKDNPLYDYKFINNEDEVCYTYNLKNKSVISISVINQTLYLFQRLKWIPESETWSIYRSLPKDNCDVFNPCGPYGNCIADEPPVCQCLEGFKPKSPHNWGAMDWSDGCVRSEPWSCKIKNRDGFRKFAGMKVPDTTQSWVNRTMNLEDCRAKCLENCSCTAYANLDIRGAGSGCAIWFGDLIDLRVIESGQDLYIRMVASETDAKHGNKEKVALVITIPLLLILVMLSSFSYFYKSKRKNRETKMNTISTKNKDEGSQEDLELPLFDLDTIVKATNDFSIDNKLGEGGFGPVYKGTLADGQEIAIKRLSRRSGQGLKEFKNEVILCTKLQHRNLVKVLGCCIEGEEKMLLYEYMPNKSLNTFLFDATRKKLLDWPKRFEILCAIARGLLYLHQDSRLRIIHRDLKASNILLDNDMNPKISDFGLARMCGGDQVEGNTSKIVGTYGYMAPEYANDGIFSIKSDVFSFGILLLEIVSGKKNKGISYPYGNLNLIGHVWKLWKEDMVIQLLDDCLGKSCILSEALRCIHIGLLCVQHHPRDRPNMAFVISMLSSLNAMPQPKEPGFLIDKASIDGESSVQQKIPSSSINEISMSLLEAR